MLSDPKGAKVLGMRYLAMYPEEADVNKLLAVFGRSPEDIKSFCDQPTLRKSLGSSQEKDFREGNTVIVDGWVLARTEARVCALAALS